LAIPATTIFPSGWIATLVIRSDHWPIGVVTMPPVPNVVSSVPSGL